MEENPQGREIKWEETETELEREGNSDVVLEEQERDAVDEQNGEEEVVEGNSDVVLEEQERDVADEQNGEEEVEEEGETQPESPHPVLPPRQRQAPIWMKDYETGNAGSGFLIQEDGEDIIAMFIAAEDSDCFEEAVQQDVWREAMESEIKSIEENNTWELMELPAGAKVIGVKWVYKTNFNETGGDGGAFGEDGEAWSL